MARSLVKTGTLVQVAETDLPMIVPSSIAELLVPEEGVTYTIRTLAPSEFERMRTKYVRFGFNPKTHRREELDLSQDDKEKFNGDVIDAVLVEWAGIEQDGQPLPCTREWKVELPLAVKAALQHVATMGAGKAAQHAESFRGPA